MAEYSNLSATINAQIRANGVQAITGPVLNAVLTAMVNVLGDGYRLNGVAVPADNPGSPDNRVAYLAAQDGTYTNFGGLTISGEVALLLWDSAWTKETLFSIDTAVTPGSGHLVTSGAVDDALTTLAGNIAAAYMQLVPAATEGNLAEFDNAGQVRDTGLATTDLATKDGHYPDLFAGFAGNLVDTRSAGTRQSFAFRQSGGDGVNYMRKILGRTEAFNQLVGDNDTEVTVPNGHKYFAIIGGTASVGTSDGTPISVTGGVDIVVDLTLEGLGLTTAEQFRALHPLPYYNYNAGVLKNNAATGLETTCIGANKYDGRIGVADAYLDPNGAEHSGPSNDITPYLPVFPSLGYFITSANGGTMGNWASYCWYDSNKAFISGTPFSGATKVHITAPATAAFVRFTTTKANGGYYFGIDTGVEVFEPCVTKTLTLGLNSIPCHDENNNAVVVNGLDGVGTSQDELIVENGWGTKINKRRARVNLGDLSWEYISGANARFKATPSPATVSPGNSNIPPIVCSKYAPDTYTNIYAGTGDKQVGIGGDANIYVRDTAYTDAAAFKAAMAGVKFCYELATPKVLTLDNPIPALIEVDNLGTEKRLPEDTADNPQAPFECDSNYSVSTANLVRLLNL